jgi:hypothetical protein
MAVAHIRGAMMLFTPADTVPRTKLLSAMAFSRMHRLAVMGSQGIVFPQQPTEHQKTP